jgi:Ca2+-binding EF-hand superfamily protein
MDTTKRIQDQYLEVPQNFGVRNEHEGLGNFMDPNSSDRVLQKFHFELNNDKLKALSKGYVQRLFKGMKATTLLKQNGMHHWIETNGMKRNVFHNRETKKLIKEVFTAIDEDGSGALDTEELIKALLCMGLSKDVDFAKRIIKVFKENQEKEQIRIRKLKEFKGELLEPIALNQEPQFTLKDFLMAFGLDEVGEKIIFAINQEIDLHNKIKKRKEEAL